MTLTTRSMQRGERNVDNSVYGREESVTLKLGLCREECVTLTTRSMQRGVRDVDKLGLCREESVTLTTRSTQRGERDVDNSVYAERRA